MPALLARLRAIDPLFWPVTDVVLTETVHVADGAPPVAIGAAMPGDPLMLLVVSVKLLAVTPLTGSEKVTVHVSGFAFVGDEPLMLMLCTTGAVVSMTSALFAPRD